MTFDEWFEQFGMPLEPATGYSLKDVSRRAWEAAMTASDALEQALTLDAMEQRNRRMEAERKLAIAYNELQRCKRIMLREFGIGLVDENVLKEIE